MNAYGLAAVLIVILLSSAAGLPTVRAADATVNKSLPTAGGDSNYSQALSNAAIVNASATQKKYIVFRDDDIAPDYPNPHYLDTLKAVNQVHIDENVPVTLAVIPHPDPNLSASTNELLGDTLLLDYLRSIVNSPLFEFAQHGYTHQEYSQKTVSTVELTGAAPLLGSGGLADDFPGLTSAAPLVGQSPSEFYGRPYADQYNIIKQGRDDIKGAFGVQPTTFVPPWNTGDSNTLKAANALGFTLYSTSPADFNTYDAILQGIRVQGVPLSLGWASDTDWQAGMSQLNQQTDSLLNAANGGGTFVVLYHFKDFMNPDGSPDPARIALFTQYIDHLKGRGDVLFSTLSGQSVLNPSPAPAVYSQDGNSLDVFAQGVYHALWHKDWNGTTGWSSWEYLGGYLTSSPVVTSSGNGAIDVFVRGTDGALWSKYTTDGGTSWSNWISLGGQIAAGTGPAACSWGSGRLDVFVEGTDGALWHKGGTGTWSSWQSLGGVLTSSPAAASQTTNSINIVVRGNDGALWHKWWSNGWSSWQSLGGKIASGTGPAASSWGSGRLDVFVEGTNGALWHRPYSGSWGGWDSLGGYLTSSPSAASSTSGKIDVFVRGGDNGLWQKTYNNGWVSWTSVGDM